MPGPAPHREREGRTARGTVEVWSLTVLAHSVAGGGLPSLLWLVAVAGLVAAATAAALRRSAHPAVLVPALLVCQLGLHVLFASLSSSGHAAHSGHQAHQAAVLAPRVLAAHVLCAVLTAVVWWMRRSVSRLVLALWQPVLVVRRRAQESLTRTPRRGPGLTWLVADPGRAPPRGLQPA